MKKILVVMGARPQFIKHVPVEIELKRLFDVVVVHTGQHYDKQMSEVFFDELGMDKPKYNLRIGSASHGAQTAGMLERIENVIEYEKPDCVLVYGDTNSTLAGALAACKMNIPVAHVEAGLRSFNKRMPEEVNRVLTDHVSTFLFAPTHTALLNIAKEGLSSPDVHLTGDVMYDSILLMKQRIGNVKEKDYVLATLHRPYNVDHPLRLRVILNNLRLVERPILFPLHPRTAVVMKDNALLREEYENIAFVSPLSYMEFIKAEMECSCIVTDSGGVQKEAYFLRKKCVTIRSETEWTETLNNGWNTLVFDDLSVLKKTINEKPGEYTEGLFGKGDASKIIAEIINRKLNH